MDVGVIYCFTKTPKWFPRRSDWLSVSPAVTELTLTNHRCNVKQPFNIFTSTSSPSLHFTVTSLAHWCTEWPQTEEEAEEQPTAGIQPSTFALLIQIHKTKLNVLKHCSCNQPLPQQTAHITKTRVTNTMKSLRDWAYNKQKLKPL